MLLVGNLDFGDAPDLGPQTGPGDYQTFPAFDGPSHVVSSLLYLGSKPTAEAESQVFVSPRADADQDDGLRNPEIDLKFTATSSPTVTVFATNRLAGEGDTATVHGWIDFNGDGWFDNVTERASTSISFGTDSQPVTLQFPQFLTGYFGATIARFRIGEIDDVAASDSVGPAGIGEVEDYRAEIFHPTTLGAEKLREYKADGRFDVSPRTRQFPFVGNPFQFGYSTAAIGDLDQNGVPDLAVGVAGKNDAVHIYFMEEDHSYSKRTITSFESAGLPSYGPQVNPEITSFTDFDGDGVRDLAVTRWEEDGSRSLYVLFLNSEGEAKKPAQKIASNVMWLTAYLGDIDRNGTHEFAFQRTLPGTSDRGLEIVSIDRHGTERGRTTISNGVTFEGLPNEVVPGTEERFADAAARLGDLDGDGIDEVVVSVSGMQPPPGSHQEYKRWTVQVLYLDANLTVRKRTNLGLFVQDLNGYGPVDFGLEPIGDLNKDGTPDLIVGNPGRETLTYPDGLPSGNVVGGASLIFVKDDGTRDSFGHFFELSGRTNYSRSGQSVTYLGRDATNETITVAIGASSFEKSGAVATYAVDASGAVVDSGLIGSFGFEGQDTKHAAALGDLDGNGYSDMAVVGNGNVQLLFMGPDGEVITTEKLFVPPELGLIYSLASAGDLDGDGLNELAVGGMQSIGPEDSPYKNGAVAILFLTPDGLLRHSTTALPEPNPGPDSANAKAADLQFGRAITSLGDLDGNGVPDLAVAQLPYTRNRPVDGRTVVDHYEPEVNILFMESDGTPLRRQTLEGVYADALTTVGDLDGDGLSEMAVGRRGSVSVHFLDSEGRLRDSVEFDYLDAIPGARFDEYFGHAVSSPGDLDGDGVADLFVGAPGSEPYRQGSIHVLLLNSDGSVKEYRYWGRDANVGFAIAPLGDLNGDGVVDVALASPPRRTWPDGGVIVRALKKKVSLDYGDAPDVSEGTGVFDYHTLPEHDGPSHLIGSGIGFGDSATGEIFPRPSNEADGDDDDGLVSSTGTITLTAGEEATVELTVTNLSGSDATLTGWIDTNMNGVFEDFESASQIVPNGTSGDVIPLNFRRLARGVAGVTYARFRISTDAAAQKPTGYAINGEVEDYRVVIETSDQINVGSVTDLNAGVDANSRNWFERIGDIDGDGHDDYLTPREIIFADTLGRTISTTALYNVSTVSATGVGDVNGDGVPDIAVGRTNLAAYRKGAVQLIMLDEAGGIVDVQTIAEGLNGGPDLPDAGIQQFGSEVHGIGDLNEDGFNDLLVANPRSREVFTLFLNADRTVGSYVRNVGPSNATWFGSSIADIGDFDGDGVPDVVIGARGYREDGITTGAAFVTLMNRDGSFKDSTLISPARLGLPVNRDDFFGDSFALLGDIDDDTVPDIAIGARGIDSGGLNGGGVYVVTLNENGTAKDATLVYEGLAGQVLGRHLLPMPDRDGNGLPEIALGTSDLLSLTYDTRDYGDADTAPPFPSHSLTSQLFLGGGVDSEGFQRRDRQASRDDLFGPLDDDDGLIDPGQLTTATAGEPLVVDLRATNLSDTKTATLYGWIDFNGNGVFEPAEQAQQDVGPRSLGHVTSLVFPPVCSVAPGTINSRFRISYDSDAAAPTGLADSGEVEDYASVLELLSFDYGDAPDTTALTGTTDYQSLAENGGPTHFVDPRLFLGAAVDGECNSEQLFEENGEVIQRLSANGDDATNVDDEDGVVQPTVDLKLVVGQPSVNVEVEVTNLTDDDATLYGWIDFNRNGRFEVNEAAAPVEIASGSAGVNVHLDFVQVPVSVGTTYARFRISTDPAASFPTGFAEDGEVEDYVVIVTDSDVEENGPSDENGILEAIEINAETPNAPELPQSWKQFGEAVAAADLDGDDITDFVVGLPFLDQVSVLLMNADGKSIRESYDLGRNTPALSPFLSQRSLFGSSVAVADMNGDGVPDIVAGAIDHRAESEVRGGAYILFMESDGRSVRSVNVVDDSTSSVSIAHTRFGSAVAVEDLNGDQIPDLVVGAAQLTERGAVYLFHMTQDGGTVRESVVLTSGPANLPYGRFGASVAAADLDQDGTTDLVVGAPGDREVGGGAVHALFMNSDGKTIREQIKFAAEAPTQSSSFGTAVAIGDFDSDGMPDLAVSSNPYVFSQVHVLLMDTDAKSVREFFTIGGDTDGISTLSELGRFGSAIAAGDFNKDGFDDLAVGEVLGGPGTETGAGALHLITLNRFVTPDKVDEAVGSLPDVPPPGGYKITSDATADNLDEWLLAIAGDGTDENPGLPEFPRPNEVVQIVLDLDEGRYEGQTIDVPSGYQLVINGEDEQITFTGASPALTVSSGDVLVTGGVTFTNQTDSPTILVNGGSLTLRDAVVEESTTGSRPAIQVTGDAVVDLGTADDLGGNTIVINGDGTLIHHTGSEFVVAVGNTFRRDSAPITDEFELAEEVYDYFEAVPGGAVLLFDDRFYDRTDLGITTLDLTKLSADLGVTGISFEIAASTGGTATLLGNKRTVRFVADAAGPGSFTFGVVLDEETIAVRTVNLHVTNVAPGVDLGNDRAGDEGDAVSFDGAYSDPGDNTTHTFAWTVTDADGEVVARGTRQAFRFTPADNGDYTVTYAVTDGLGATGTDELLLAIANVAPSVAVDQAAVSVDEAETATNNGTFSDPGADDVSLTASIGQVTSSADGTWDWLWDTSDGPDDSQTVTITATDSDGDKSEVSFALTVENVSPAFTAVTSSASRLTDASENGVVTVQGIVVDPGTDTQSVTIHWGDGVEETVSVDAATSTFSKDHQYAEGGVYSILVIATDSDDDRSLPVSTQAFVQGVGIVDRVLHVVGTASPDDASLWIDDRNKVVRVLAHLDQKGRRRKGQWIRKTYPIDQVEQAVALLSDGADSVVLHDARRADRTISLPVFVDAGPGDDLVLTGAALDTVIGGAGHDVIRTGDGNDIIDAGLGRNIIHSGDGDDAITAGNGDDRIDSGRGDDVIQAGNGHNRILSGMGNDRVTTGSGADRIFDLSGDNVVDTGAGDDVVTTGWGADRIDVGAGDDHVHSGPNSDLVIAGAGNDRVQAGAGNDVVIGGAGRDSLRGSFGEDLMIAGSLNATTRQLDGLFTDWSGTAAFLDRVRTIREHSGAFGEELLANAKAANDSDRDTVRGGLGRDWLFATGSGEKRDLFWRRPEDLFDEL